MPYPSTIDLTELRRMTKKIQIGEFFPQEDKYKSFYIKVQKILRTNNNGPSKSHKYLLNKIIHLVNGQDVKGQDV